MSHHELGRDGGEEAGYDETGAAGCLGDEGHRRQWHPVARTQERRHAQDKKKGVVHVAQGTSNRSSE